VHSWRVVKEVQTGARAELEYATGWWEKSERLAAESFEKPPFEWLNLAVVVRCNTVVSDRHAVDAGRAGVLAC
jgi:hypothetical protein